MLESCWKRRQNLRDTVRECSMSAHVTGVSTWDNANISFKCQLHIHTKQQVFMNLKVIKQKKK